MTALVQGMLVQGMQEAKLKQMSMKMNMTSLMDQLHRQLDQGMEVTEVKLMMDPSMTVTIKSSSGLKMMKIGMMCLRS